MSSSKKSLSPPWKPGQSGNPAGRPKGSGEVGKLRKAIAAHVPAIIKQLTDQALGGDVQAARLLLERTVAPLKAVEPPQPLTLPDGTLTDQGRAVLAAVSAGVLAPGQGAQLVAAIGQLARVAEIDELTRRIEQLERSHGNP
ncbi:DUF5681 domain-containing protein [Brachymonas denitrificans]|uniref:DUF5681 domain-containing protein n=1 Tax=Brachymonas denitrificans TaxID=28220 RepID=UPI001BD116D2|nr:DUF5681 domain-containing protein [Brachymonas denitrificans]